MTEHTSANGIIHRSEFVLWTCWVLIMDIDSRCFQGFSQHDADTIWPRRSKV